MAALEDVVAVSHRPPDPRFPVACFVVGFDEGGKELAADARPRQPMAPAEPASGGQPGRSGRAARVDSEHVRHGRADLFVGVAPPPRTAGRRRHPPSDGRRTAVASAVAMRALVDDPRRAEAERIVPVLDHRNTHRPASLYEAFPPAEARRILNELEFHFTPLHGSRRNVAEIELSVLAQQGLAQRIPDDATPQRAVAAWAERRTAAQVGVDRQFTAADARVKPHRLYPVPVFAT